MDEHASLVDQADHLRAAQSSGDPEDAMSRLTGLVDRLTGHVTREEEGIFRALRHTGEYVAEVEELEGEHRDLEPRLPTSTSALMEFEGKVKQLLDDLDVHVQREELRMFPVSVVTLGAAGWTIVEEAHTKTPSFLLDPADRHLRSVQQEESPCRRNP